MKVNLDWWNTCNAFPPIFYFGLICFQAPSVGEGQCPPFTETMPGYSCIQKYLYTIMSVGGGHLQKKKIENFYIFVIFSLFPEFSELFGFVCAILLPFECLYQTF